MEEEDELKGSSYSRGRVKSTVPCEEGLIVRWELIYQRRVFRVPGRDGLRHPATEG